MIVVVTFIAAASMFVDWVDIGIASASGMSQGTYLLLGFFVYPLVKVLRLQPINRLIGVGCGIGGVLATSVYIASKEGEFAGRSFNAAAGGAYLFLFCCVALIVGVVKCRNRNEEVEATVVRNVKQLGHRWDASDIGAKTVFLSTCLAVLSVLISWRGENWPVPNKEFVVNLGLLCLFIYPVLKLVRGQPMSRLVGVACGIAGVVLELTYVLFETASADRRATHTTPMVAYIFMSACVWLCVGVFMHRPSAGNPGEAGSTVS